jgi:hypothetical protein
MTEGKPSGVAAAQATATDIGRLAELESSPAAWATFYPNGSTASVYTGRQPPNAEPLYRSPTLTDAERRAIGVAIQCVEAAMAQRHPEEEDSRDLLHKTSCTLSRLFERTTL